MLDNQNLTPVPTNEQAGNVPDEMKQARQWITWRLEERDDRLTKVPTDPRTGKVASATDAGLWVTFDEAYAAAVDRGHGVGFSFANGWCGIDLDHCVIENDMPTPEAQQIVDFLTSYTEYSPSRTGFHIIVKAKLPGGGHKKESKDLPAHLRSIGAIEMYDSGRFFTVTGDIHARYSVAEERQSEVESLYRKLYPNADGWERHAISARRVRAAIALGDEEIKRKILESSKAPKFEKLWNGDMSDYLGTDGRPDHSAADLALCGILAYWLDGDNDRMDKWFRASQLMRPKWDERHGSQKYGERTIDTVLGRSEYAQRQGKKSFEKGYCHLGFEIRDEAAVFHVGNSDGKLAQTFVCSLVEMLGEARNLDGTGWALCVRLLDRDGSLSEVRLPRVLIEDTRELFKFLVDRGVVLAPPRHRGRKLLVKYLSAGTAAKRARLVKTTGWHGSVFVLPDRWYGESSEAVLFEGDKANHPYHINGTLEAWRERVAALCVGNSRMVFATSAGFAGPLIPLATDASPGFHLFGLSSRGKTTTLHTGASVCGGGETVHGYLETWRATANGLERVAALHNHALLCLDEIKELDPRETGEVIYMLGNGIGKRRMKRDTSLAESPTWQIVTLSSGEPSTEDYARESGKRLRGGQRVRMIDIPADAGRGLGVFENIHGSDSPAAFSLSVSKAARENFGYPLRALLESLTTNHNAIAERYRERVGSIANRFSSVAAVGDSGEVHRVAGYFALIAAAGEIATELKITGWEPGEAQRATETCFQAWLERRGCAGSSDKDAMIRFVRLLIERDGASRFQPIGEDRDSDRTIVHDRLGYKWNESSRTVYFFLPEVFEHECTKQGLEFDLVTKALSEVGMLLMKEPNRLQYKKRVPHSANPVRGYAVFIPDEDIGRNSCGNVTQMNMKFQKVA